MSTTGLAILLPAMIVNRCSAERRPIASRGVLMLLKRGTMKEEAGKSLKPNTATRSGTLMPWRRASSSAPWARSSLPKKIASTSMRRQQLQKQLAAQAHGGGARRQQFQRRVIHAGLLQRAAETFAAQQRALVQLRADVGQALAPTRDQMRRRRFTRGQL